MRVLYCIVGDFTVLLFLSALSVAMPSSCADADLIIHNARIVTMDAARPSASAMAIRDGRILAIGSDQDLLRCASERSEVEDMKQLTVLPGLIDVHTHAMEWTKGILRGQIDAGYPNVHTISEITQEVRRRAEKMKHDEWIVGSGWDDAKLTEHRYITRGDLDPVSANNPVYLVHVSGHLSVANSVALKFAGITKQTPDPQGGVIERDQTGEPTGILKDTAMLLIANILPPDPADLNERAAKLVSEKATEVGLTTIHDIFLSPEEMKGYQDAYQKGWLKIRVQMSPQIGSIADAEKLAHSGVHTGFGDDHLKFGAAKMFADGGMGARTIAIYPPGVIGEPDNIGVLRWTSEDMQRAHLLVAGGGWQLETHAIGDRAIDQVLDSYAVIIKKLGLKDPRFRIVHAGISTPAVQKRMRELKVVVDGNPPFVYWIGSWFTKYGPERVRWSYPARSYIENGIIEAAGSDVDVTPISPWWGIWAAVERKDFQTGKVLAAEERLTILEALRLYTLNGAYAGFEEDQKGSLAPGKLADFIVVDRDVLSVPNEQLKEVKVLKTYVGGRLIYNQKPFLS